jgi:ComF family protein
LYYREPLKVAILPQHPSLQQLGRQLGNLLLPGSCLLCSDHSGEILLCPACATDLPILSEACCPQCGEQSTPGQLCGACLKKPPHFASTTALFRYDFPTDRLVQALKYTHQLAVGAWLGQLLAEHLRNHPADLVIPMPLHPERLRERGFNQAVEIARPIARSLGKTLALNGLHRIRATPPQAALKLKARANNVRGAFECRQEIEGRKVLLVDDVMTSGATLNEAARILMLHGAARVDVAVAARALKQ